MQFARQRPLDRRSFPVETLGDVPVPDRRLARRGRDLVPRLHQEARRERRRRRSTSKRARNSPNAHAKLANARDRATLTGWAERLRGDLDRRTIEHLDRFVTVARRAIDRQVVTTFDATSPVWVDRPLARCSAWYELFPRSTSPDPTRPGHARRRRRRGCRTSRRWVSTSSTSRRSTRSARRTARAATTRPTARAKDPGSPWAIGGGRRRPHRGPSRPRHGRRRRSISSRPRARHDLEIALDLAFQTSPDHPWVREHPGWFRHRPDGTIAYAENPPKRYEDIYPLDFDCADREGLWTALLDVVRFWIERGVPRLPRRQPAHQALRVLGMAHRYRARDRPRRHLPRRGVHPATRDGAARQARLHAVVHVLHVAQRRSGSSPSTSPS